MPIAPIDVDLAKYAHVTIVSPIWVFALAAPMRAFCGEAAGKIRTADYILVHHTRGQYENAAVAGGRELLERLKAKGYTLALASSKPEELCVSICARFGFTPSLAAVTGSPAGADWDKADVIREAMRRLGLTDADKPAILMVGDRKYDVLGAAECGIACVGVEFFGYAAPGELAEAGAAAVVQTPEELEDYILNH